MSKLSRVFVFGISALLIAFCWSRTVLALSDDFTFGDFENMQYVDPGNNYNNTVSQGWINNGPTPDAITATSSAPSYPTNEDYPPAGDSIPSNYPHEPGGGPGETYGNWNQIYDTGWDSWYGSAATNHLALYSNSTTTGVTHGTTAIKVNPNSFGTNPGTFQQDLAFSLTNMGLPPSNNPSIPDDTSLAQPTFNNFLTNTYIAYDVTFKTSDWTYNTLAGTGATRSGGTTTGGGIGPGVVQLQLWSNMGGGSSTTPEVDRFGFHPLGQYVQNMSDANTPMARTPDVDSRQSLLGGTGGVWVPSDSNPTTGTYTTTLYYNYSHWQSSPTVSDGGTGSGGPPTGQYYDERSFATNGITMLGPRSGYLEFMIENNYDTGYTAGDFFVDNFRFTNTPLRLGDFNNDGHVDASDIVTMEQALANPAAYEANPTGLPPGDSLSAQDMLTIGDINGDGKFNNADLQALIADLKAGLGSTSAVPEPSGLLLLALGGIGLAVRRRIEKNARR